MQLRKWLRILHRDTGYFIVGVTVIYAVSGIFLNHKRDINADYHVITRQVEVNLPVGPPFQEKELKPIIEAIDDDIQYKRSYMTSQGYLKAFIHNGEVVLDPETGKGELQMLRKRALIFEMNNLHRISTHKSWKWISDAFAAILLFVTLSGIFILKGKNGFMKRGIWFILGGIVIPVVYMVFLM